MSTNIITLAGDLGSGKSSVRDILKQKYNYDTYSTGDIQRQIAQSLGLSILEFNKLCCTDRKYDNLLDERTANMSKTLASPTVIDSRMAWHFVPTSFKVFLYVDKGEAAKRIMDANRGTEQYRNLEDAMKQIQARTESENIRFKELYNVDNLDLNNYDLIVDTTWLEPEEVADIIQRNAQTRVQSFGATQSTILLSPKSLFPTDKINHISTTTYKSYLDDLKGGKSLKPLLVVYRDHCFFIQDGHHRLIAHLLNNSKIIEVSQSCDSTFTLNLPTELQYLGISTLYDYEDLGHFTYKSYPTLYNQHTDNSKQ